MDRSAPARSPGGGCAAGFGAVEIWYWRRWDIAALAARCREVGLSVAQLGGWDFEPPLSDPEVHRAFESELSQAFGAAERLGVRLVNINGPYDQAGISPGDAKRTVIAALQRVAPLAEKSGMTLMVEPMNIHVDHPSYSMPYSADVISVCEAVGSNSVKINWDLYHLYINEGDLTGHFANGLRLRGVRADSESSRPP